MSQSLVAAVLAETHPDRDVSGVEQLPQGHRRETVVARFRSASPVVVQFSSESAALEIESILRQAIRDRTTLPVPAPLARGVCDGTPYLVSEHSTGTDLHTVFPTMDSGDRRRIASQFGQYLGELHDAFQFDGCGSLTLVRDTTAQLDGEKPVTGDSNEFPLVPSHTDCREWLREYGMAAVERLPPAFDDIRDKLVACLRTGGDMSGGSLFPWDLRPGNALVADGDVTALVDWEGPLAAPVPLSVAKVEYLVADWYVENPAPLRTAFRDGYCRVLSYPEVQPSHRVAAIADSAVDSTGKVTNQGYPVAGRERAIEFHRAALSRALSD